MTTQLDYLGHRRALRGRHGMVQHHVYVLWIAGTVDLLHALLHLQARAALRCPECGGDWPVTRDGGLLFKLSEHPVSTVRSISTVCADCPTAIHFDLTAAAARPRVRWVRMYERNPHVMGDRPSRVGASCLAGGHP